MSEPEKTLEEVMAQAFSVIYRMSQILNIPLEDAATIYLKIAAAAGEAFTKKAH